MDPVTIIGIAGGATGIIAKLIPAILLIKETWDGIKQVDETNVGFIEELEAFEFSLTVINNELRKENSIVEESEWWNSSRMTDLQSLKTELEDAKQALRTHRSSHFEEKRERQVEVDMLRAELENERVSHQEVLKSELDRLSAEMKSQEKAREDSRRAQEAPSVRDTSTSKIRQESLEEYMEQVKSPDSWRTEYVTLLEEMRHQ